MAGLVDYVGPAKAKELIMLAKLLTADEALSLGVVTEIVPADQLEPRVGEIAHRLTTLAPLTLAATRNRFAASRPHARWTARKGEDLILSCYMSDDFRGGAGLRREAEVHLDRTGSAGCSTVSLVSAPELQVIIDAGEAGAADRSLCGPEAKAAPRSPGPSAPLRPGAKKIDQSPRDSVSD